MINNSFSPSGNSFSPNSTKNDKSIPGVSVPRCMLMNARSICNKYDKLLDIMKLHDPALLGITETWLQPEINFKVPEYVVFRCDRDTKGGVMLCVKPALNPTFISQNKIGSIEIVTVSILKNFGVILVYRPPNSPKADLISLIRTLDNQISQFDKFTIVGDFNLPLIDWQTYSSNDDISNPFLDFCNDNSLFQFVNFPTRSNNILDSVLSSNNNVLRVDSLPPIGASDHTIITYCLDEYYDDNFIPFYIYDYETADYELINAFLLTIDWNELFAGCVNTSDHWLRFCELINYIHTEFIPVRLIRKHVNANNRKWRKLYRSKREKWKKYERTNLERDKINYILAKTEYENYVALKKVNYEKQKFYNRKKNPKAFYNYVNRHMSNDPLIPTLSTTDGLSMSESEKAETFSAQFKNFFMPDNMTIPQTQPCDINFPSRFDLVTPAEALIAMKSINVNSAAGPDGISPKFYKKCAANFAQPVCIILNKSFNEGFVLDDWKFANVTPIFKGGDKSNPINYRPISITSVFSKVAEYVIKDRILSHLRLNGLMTKFQHGFTCGRSVTTNLLECLDDWSKNLENQIDTDVIYFDFSKAFDSVVHSKLLSKLETQFQLHVGIVNWVRSFLSNRYQRVKVGRAYSEPVLVTSGVAQGSLLGPLLFIMYTCDITRTIQHSKISLYADDTKLYHSIRDNFDSELLQMDCESLMSYSIAWQLPLNPSKTLYLAIPFSEGRFYTVSGTDVRPQRTCKDLGIKMQQNLKFNEHINIITRNANFNIKNMKMCFQNHGPFFYLFQYLTYVRPTLESSTIIFSPHNIELIDKIEGVQRRFTKYLPGLFDLTYRERLEFLGIKSLEERRIIFDLLFLFKVITGKTNLNPDSFFSFNINPTRGHKYKIVGTFAKNNIRKYFWPNRIVDIWNGLPAEIIDNLQSFEPRLKTFDLSPNCVGSSFS